jgi:hypothetical protein
MLLHDKVDCHLYLAHFLSELDHLAIVKELLHSMEKSKVFENDYLFLDFWLFT